jgi:hypothetical protein
MLGIGFVGLAAVWGAVIRNRLIETDDHQDEGSPDVVPHRRKATHTKRERNGSEQKGSKLCSSQSQGVVSSGDDQSSSYGELVGNTPLVLLKRLSQLLDCQIYVKMECLNPGTAVLTSRIALPVP